EADARTDIFAFGAVLYEMITGRRPFQGKTPASLMASILATNPEMPSHSISGVPPLLDHVIQRCLEKDPANRWHSARDVWFELKVASDPSHPLTSPLAAPKPGNRRLLKTAAVFIAAAAVLAVGVLYYQTRNTTQQTAAIEKRFEIPVAGL